MTVTFGTKRRCSCTISTCLSGCTPARASGESRYTTASASGLSFAETTCTVTDDAEASSGQASVATRADKRIEVMPVGLSERQVGTAGDHVATDAVGLAEQVAQLPVEGHPVAETDLAEQ